MARGAVWGGMCVQGRGGSVCAGVRVFVRRGACVCRVAHGGTQRDDPHKEEPQVSGSSHHKLQAMRPHSGKHSLKVQRRSIVAPSAQGNTGH